MKKGILSVYKIPTELLKYGKRLGTDDPAKISAWLEKTFSGRSRAISVLTEPVKWEGNDPMLKEWIDQKKLIAIDNTETFSQLRSRIQDAFGDIDIDLAPSKLQKIFREKA